MATPQTKQTATAPPPVTAEGTTAAGTQQKKRSHSSKKSRPSRPSGSGIPAAAGANAGNRTAGQQQTQTRPAFPLGANTITLELNTSAPVTRAWLGTMYFMETITDRRECLKLLRALNDRFGDSEAQTQVVIPQASYAAGAGAGAQI